MWYKLAVKFEDDKWYKIEAFAPNESTAKIFAETKASCEGHTATEIKVLDKTIYRWKWK